MMQMRAPSLSAPLRRLVRAIEPFLLAMVWISITAATPASYEATRTRPLFSPTRRPPPPQAARVLTAPAVPVAPPPALILAGVILGDGTDVALLRHPSEATAATVRLGGRIDGWTVSDIQRRAVTLRQGDRSVTIALPEPRR